MRLYVRPVHCLLEICIVKARIMVIMTSMRNGGKPPTPSSQPYSNHGNPENPYQTRHDVGN